MSMIKYNIYNKGSEELFKDISNRYSVSEMVARIMVNRDIPVEEMGEYIRPDINKMYNPYLLTDVKPAAELTKKAIEAGSKIRIIGDYDIDGVMSTYILIDALSKVGANVDYQIPHRIEDGYGLNESIIKRAIDDSVNLIITCDNGVSAISEIQLARDNSIDVIVTDHHEFMHDEAGKELRPNANYIINPKRDGDNYPYKKLCGAVVAWKFIIVLLEMCGVTPHLQEDNTYIAYEGVDSLLSDSSVQPIMKYLQFAAFATIGDVMELTGENRVIVKYGLEQLSRTDNIGMRTLIQNRLDNPDVVSAYHIGFVLGPCINASGRLDSATLSLQLLLEEDAYRVDDLATQLITLNAERKTMTDEGVEEAIRSIEESDSDDKVLVIYVPNIHESVAGIVAGRIREKYCKPTIVLCDGEECVKGSGRSIESYNMYEALHDCKDLFIKFGGHPMAAGLSLDMGNVDVLRRRLNDECMLSDEDFIDLRIIDMTVNPAAITIDMVEQLEYLEPFGNGNKKPLLAQKNIKIQSIKRIGSNRFFKMQVTQDGVLTDALYFQDADELEHRLIDRFGEAEYKKALRGQDNNITTTIMFYPQINEFRGNRSVQLVLSDVVI